MITATQVIARARREAEGIPEGQKFGFMVGYLAGEVATLETRLAELRPDEKGSAADLPARAVITKREAPRSRLDQAFADH